MEILLIDKIAIEHEAAYLYALDWVDKLEPDIPNKQRGFPVHLRRQDGTLLITLDEVIRAVLVGELGEA